MKKIILTIIFILGIIDIVNANDNYNKSNYQSYFNGYGFSPGYTRYNNGWNSIDYPAGKFWYHSGFQPLPHDSYFYPNANYNFNYSIPYYNSYMRIR